MLISFVNFELGSGQKVSPKGVPLSNIPHTPVAPFLIPAAPHS